MTAEIRAFSAGDMLDGAFTLYRRNFALLFLTALLPQVPVLVLWLVTPVLFGGAPTFTTEVLPLLVSPYSLFAYILVMGAVTHAAARAYAGEATTVGDALGRGLRRWFPLAIGALLSWIIIMFGIVFFIVPGLIALAMFFAVAPAIMEEDAGAVEALGRSRSLSKGARMRILLVLLVAYFITMLPSIAMWMIAGVSVGMGAMLGGEAAAGTTWFMATTQAAAVLLSSLTLPFLLIVSLLLYYDRRARTEAPELEQAAAELQQRAY